MYFPSSIRRQSVELVLVFVTNILRKSQKSTYTKYFVKCNNSVAQLATKTSSEIVSCLEQNFIIPLLFKFYNCNMEDYWDFYIAISTEIDRNSFVSSDLVAVVKWFDQNNQKCFLKGGTIRRHIASYNCLDFFLIYGEGCSIP